MYFAGIASFVEYITTITIEPTMPAMMNVHRRNVALAAEALVLASRHAMGLNQTDRGLRVRSPLMMCSFCSTQLRSDVVDCASRRSSRIEGTTRTRLRTSVTVM